MTIGGGFVYPAQDFIYSSRVEAAIAFISLPSPFHKTHTPPLGECMPGKRKITEGTRSLRSGLDCSRPGWHGNHSPLELKQSRFENLRLKPEVRKF